MVESNEQIEKLKELEQTLAKELDQQVRLTEASDPRLQGSVAVNPSLETKIPKGVSELPEMANRAGAIKGQEVPAEKASAPASGGQAPEISLADVDALLSQLDEGFKKNIDALKSDINEAGNFSDAAPLESISISKDYLKSGDKAEDEPDKDPDAADDDLIAEIISESKFEGALFLESLSTFIKRSLKLPFQAFALIVVAAIRFKNQRLKAIDDFTFSLNEHFKRWREAARGLIKSLKAYDRYTYLRICGALVLTGFLLFLVRDIFTNFREDKQVDPYLRNFHDVASREVLLPAQDENEDNPLHQPQNVVVLHRIIANLKPASPKETPMIAMELYIEASGPDTAIEIHDRELEVKDSIERISEETTFQEMDSAHGKERFKSRVATALNQILNKGRAKRVFFKSLNIKQ